MVAASLAAPINPAIKTRTLVGLHAYGVTVECHIGSGLPSTTIVGLAEGAVREARDRVRAALINSGFKYPDGHLVINLAPGTVTKSSPALDLPIALSILAASKQISCTDLDQFEFLGELGLFGELRRINGALTCAMVSHQHGRTLVVPGTNANEASVAPRRAIALADNLLEVTAALNEPTRTLREAHCPTASVTRSAPTTSAFSQVIGQQAAKRALAIAAAGGHHVLMVGPPGTGKTMLARGFSELMGSLDGSQALEVAAIYSAAGLQRDDYHQVPFRDPHHSASAAALIGGGSSPHPGEVALAHHGILFLDELPHFKPSALDLLREPIETGEAVIARAKYKVRYPCRFQLIAAMNPCPAGRTCNESACRCTSAQVQRYQSRISGPLLDRIDIQVRVPELPQPMLVQLKSLDGQQTNVAVLISQITRARAQQRSRQTCTNANLHSEQLRTHMRAADLDEAFLTKAVERYRLSARSYHKIWRISRTIADLAHSPTIHLDHMTEALSYRALDWEAGV